MPARYAPETVRPDSAAATRSAGKTFGQAAVQTAKTGVQTTRNVSRGLAGFLRPFQRVGGILWLEVTGVFFLLFVFALAPTLWRARLSYAHGPDHRTFWSAAAIMIVFLYLGISSFWRARKK
jgi:hypothetical protein